MNFRLDIQGLRALAVLLVFVFHLNSSILSGGFIGVDIFFVISGFLVSSVILDKKRKDDFHFLDFYIGRIKRIMPVFLLLLIVVGVVGSFVYLSGDIQGLRKNMFWSALFNSNNYLSNLDDYFGASSLENPLLHTWTLSIEMQFYFLLPIFLIFTRSKSIVHLSLFCVILLLSYSFYNSTFLNTKNFMYFSLIARIPEFLIGTVFAIKANAIKLFIGSKQNLFSTLSLIGIVSCGFLFTGEINFPGLWVLLPCLFTGIILITTESKVNKLFTNKILVHLGELSYSIYLWHWALMAFVRYYYVKIDFTWYEIIGIIFSTYFISYLSYTFVENKLRKLNNRRFFLCFVVILLCLGFTVFSMPKLNKRFSDIPQSYSTPTIGLDSHGPTFTKVGVYGDIGADGRDSICLIGDSHALAYIGFLDEIGKLNGFKFYTITNDRVPTIQGLDEDEFSSKRLYNQYERLVKESEIIIDQSNLIIIASIWSKGFPSIELALENLLEGLREEQKVLLLGDYPVFSKNPLKINRSIIKTERYTEIKNEKYISEEPLYIRELLQKYPDRFFKVDFNFNISEELPFINDTIAYYDDGHWNAYGSRQMGVRYASDFIDFLKKKKIN